MQDDTPSADPSDAALSAEDLLPALASYVRAGRCALFVGAGLSRAVGYPTWKGLLERLIAQVPAATGGDREPSELRALLDAGKYADLADQCRELLGPSQLFGFLRRELSGRQPRLESHGAITRTPYRCIVTTNFDTLLEHAYASWSPRGVPRAPCGHELAEHGTLLLDDAFFILKAHGSISDAASIVFATEDYRRIIHANPAFQSVMSTILLSNAILFVGYSLSDPNFRLLLESQLTTFGAQAPPRYAIMEGVGPYERALMERTMGIRVLSYPKGEHQRVDQLLQELAGASAAPGERAGPARARQRLPDPLQTLAVSIRTRGPLMYATWHEADSREWAADSLALEKRAFDSLRPIPWDRLAAPLAAVADGGQPDIRGVHAVGRLLASVLPRPLLAMLAVPGRELVLFDVDPAAASLPWEWTSVNGVPLIDLVPVARTMPNVSDEARGRPFPQTPLRALIIGDTQPMMKELGGQRMVLPGSAAEARNIARAVRRSHRGAHAGLLVGADATYERVMRELQAARFDIVHFAGHAWVENGAAYLALYDHVVYASELAMLLNRHPPALLFVNSHHTGFVPAFTRVAPLDLPRYASIEDLHGRLRRRRFGFEYVAARAGVGSFVGCMGEPTDAAARAIAEQTYERLLGGAPLGRALYDARRTAADGAVVTPYCTLLAGYPDLRLAADRPRRSNAQAGT
jgi:hypothetical protein